MMHEMSPKLERSGQVKFANELTETKIGQNLKCIIILDILASVWTNGGI